MRFPLIVAIIIILSASSAFALTTRQITNTAALTDSKGVPLANVPITFTLVDKSKRPADGWDAYTHERIAPIPVTVKTNSLGIFSIYLWPTSRGTAERYYLCHVGSSYAGIADFMSALDSGATSLEWIMFMAAGGVLVPNGNSAFSAIIQPTAAEKAALDAANTPSSSNAFATMIDLVGVGVPVTTNMNVVISSDYGCASGWQAGALATEVAALVSAGVSASNILCRDIQ